jgi:hypothetical protein
MIKTLSSKYQKEIALTFISVFFIFGLSSLKAENLSSVSNRYYFDYSSARHHPQFYNHPENNSGSDKVNSTIANTTSNGKPIVKLLSDGENMIPFNRKAVDKVTIGGPSQPEMGAFKPVGSDNMVSPFTGDFSYNIPLLDVGGYPVNMFYSSGITMDQESSWVGLGWNINPGTITRNMRGLPDDFNGTDTITRKQSIRPDKTWGVSGGAGLKFAGFPMLGLNVNAGLSYNNKLGIATEIGIHPALSISSKAADDKTSGTSYGATVGANLNINSRSGATVTPSISMDITDKDGKGGSTSGSLGVSVSYNSRIGIEGMHLDAGVSKSKAQDAKHYNNTNNDALTGSLGTLSSSLSFAYPTITPSVRNILTRRSYNLSFSMGFEWTAVNAHFRIGGYYTDTRIDEADQITTHPAYGILHSQEANNDVNALLDFNRLNDGVYTPNSPAIALPAYSYDLFSINGEGTGGSFRAYRGDLGFMRDSRVRTRDDAASLGVDLGFGNTVHGGAEFSYAFTPTEVGAWHINNAAMNAFLFKKNKEDYQAVYFKNPGEKTIPDASFQQNVGGEDLVRLKLANIGSGTPMLLPTLVKYDATKNFLGELPLINDLAIKKNRDKRTQVISFLNADEASRVGFDKKIYSYDPDTTKIIYGACDKSGIEQIERNTGNPNYNGSDKYRKPHHISEVDVLGTDGRKYVYGIPVYNTKQVDVTFNVNNGDNSTGKSNYTPGIDDTKNNKNGRDWYMQEEDMPAYTHSFLLTALVSPNYVDVTGDGITEDDMGDAIKFNYTKFNQGYKWRTPIGSGTATYSEGLKTDSKDDKAHYIYGEREMWHLYSVESKNMVARFYVKNDRKDCRQVVGPDGLLDNGWGMQRLDKICLYSKGDLVRFGSAAKPIKTIRFFQSYKLCKNITTGIGNNSIAGEGKLTLDSIWVTYNGNVKKAKSRYVFYYPANNNPDYNYNHNDRWGNYKPLVDGSANNPGGLLNSDYPYSVQNQAKANKYAAAWTMDSILLPSGGTIKVNYESDDYAYVQNKKAASMCQILGFGDKLNPANPSANNRLYSSTTDYDYIYIKLPNAIPITANSNKDKLELAAHYFENTTQIYMKLAVVMPSGSGLPGLAGTEMISVYADIDDYGLVPANSSVNPGTVAWVRIKRILNGTPGIPMPGFGTTPMVQQALQFLKQQLPGKAYPGYDVSESGGVQSVVMALAGMVSAVVSLKMGDDNALKAAHKCREVETDKSFARLTNPTFFKYGGGLRVKSIVISDNWDKMTGQYRSTYGQQYKYTTTELINGAQTIISSGVASWEPSIGGDENPHREIMRYMNHNKGGPYDFGAIEMPLGEMYYPSPSVGYSKVEVLSIHRDTVKNMPTRQVTEFYTTKDFPFKSSCTQLSDPESNVKYAPSAILQLLKLDMKKVITQSQGFLVDMNDMTGKVKIQATYSATDSINPISYTQNYYNVEKATDNTYKFNHYFPTLNKPDGNVVANSIIGRDIELMADFREHKSETITTNINVNFDFFFVGIFPIPLTNLLQPTIYEGMTYRSASLLKIVNHYGILDSVVSVDKGSMVSTKNLVYDAETGNPLLTRTNNEHNKPIYNFSYPAHWAYSGMGPAYQNIDVLYDNLTFRNGVLETQIDMSSFESGDELYAFSEKDKGPAAGPCDNVYGSCPYNLTKNQSNRIWAVNTAKVGSLTPQWVFMDADGNPYTAQQVSIRIIRSGHRNLLDQTIGTITSMSNPVNSSGHLVFSDATNIIHTTAATFKDMWRVDDKYYPVIDHQIQTSIDELSIGDNSSTEVFNDVKYDGLGNTFNVGHINTPTNSNGNNCFIVKINPDHQILWQKTIPNIGDADFKRVTVCSNGDAVAVGYIRNTSLGSYQRAFICRFTGTGTLTWSMIAEVNEGGNTFVDAVETVNGNIAVLESTFTLGSNNPWAVVMLLNYRGEKVWAQRIANNINFTGSSQFMTVNQYQPGGLYTPITNRLIIGGAYLPTAFNSYSALILEIDESSGSVISNTSYPISTLGPPTWPGLKITSLWPQRSYVVNNNEVYFDMLAFTGLDQKNKIQCLFKYDLTSKDIVGNYYYHPGYFSGTKYSSALIAPDDFLLTQSIQSGGNNNVFLSRVNNPTSGGIVYDEQISNAKTIYGSDVKNGKFCITGIKDDNSDIDGYVLFDDVTSPFSNTVCNNTNSNSTSSPVLPYFHLAGPALSNYPYSTAPYSTFLNSRSYSQNYLCEKITDIYYCTSVFGRKAINPYVEGYLGNWRVDSTYAYYGERNETNPNDRIDTRTSGSIKNFKTFWNFNSNYLQRNGSSNNVWVWNSTITQYNRKGYEIENKDPLGRYNAGLYGYNQQLPVAVANNSRVREVMYDGFEDYDYQTALNCTSYSQVCKPTRHADFGNIASIIDSTQKHTGKYGLRVRADSAVNLSFPIVDPAIENPSYGLRIRVDSTLIAADTTFTPKGTGVYVEYFQDNIFDPFPNGYNHSLGKETLPTVSSATSSNQSWNSPSGYSFRSVWTGIIQPKITGHYSFIGSRDDGAEIWLNGGIIYPDFHNGAGLITTTSYLLYKGQSYHFKIKHNNEGWGPSNLNLLWRNDDCTADYEYIPTDVLIPENPPSVPGSGSPVQYNTNIWCKKLDSVKVKGNALTDHFSPIQGKKMVLSLWVKENSSDCKCSTYEKNDIEINYSGVSVPVEIFHPAGNIIEGWQRYEAIFTIPPGARAINVTLKNLNEPGGNTVYFDDIRIHPFNANVKSFVYNSSNLRLMAELDENNFATFYEYDDDGTLTRLKKETERGIKTIKETRSAMQKAIEP